MAKIALNSKDSIKPFVIVDDEDVADLSQFNWTWSGGYAKARMKQPDGTAKSVSMHRYIVGAKELEIVDHINRLKYDNRKSNLRLVTNRQNSWNRGKSDVHRGTSAYVGVSLLSPDGPERWISSIQCHQLGVYDSEEEAAYVRDQAAMQLHGDYAYLNFNYEPLI